MVRRGSNGPTEVAALYVDLNGLIHPCCHGEDPALAAAPEAEKLERIVAALDELVLDTSPSALLYLAMDGVAPRAKMNQQRARRYGAAAGRFPDPTLEEPTLGAEDSDEKTKQELAEVAASLNVGSAAAAEDDAFGFLGEDALTTPAATVPAPSSAQAPSAPAANAGTEAFDSNGISPGTPFMVAVSNRLRAFVDAQLSAPEESKWNPSLAVIFSDSNCPGEGEHKIVDFMRTHVAHNDMRRDPGAHVIVGLDADLILLGMSLHVENVFILRDNDRDRVAAATPTPAVDPLTPEASESDGDGKDEDALSPSQTAPTTTTMVQPVLRPRRKKLEFFDLSVAADLLVSEIVSMAAMLLSPQCVAQVQAAPHRVVDDFIVMCTMLGNDFMPRLPSGHCGDNACDNFIECYVRAVLPKGFMVNTSGELDLPLFAFWLTLYQHYEAMLFRQFLCKRHNTDEYLRIGAFPAPKDEAWRVPYRRSTGQADPAIREKMCGAYLDGLRFVWKYYSTTSVECPWRWYYPYDYAPLASDLLAFVQSVGQDALHPLPAQVEAPAPFVQLLCILPPTSCSLLPPPLRRVMLQPPAELEDTFPRRWRIDEAASGGMAHLCTVLLPFADLERLESVVGAQLASIAPADAARNINQDGYHLIVRKDHRLYSVVPPTDATGTDDGAAAQGSSAQANFRWARSATIQSDQSSDAVAVLAVPTKIPTRRSKPRTYNVLPPRMLPSVPKAMAHPAPRLTPLQRQFTPNGSGLHAVDTLLASALVTALAMLGAGAALSMVLYSVTFIFGSALLLCALGFGDNSDSGSAQLRNTARETKLDWLCSGCSCLNFGRNEQCFVCGQPFETQRCPAVYTSVFQRSPHPMDPDHTAYVKPIGLQIPDRLLHEDDDAKHAVEPPAP